MRRGVKVLIGGLLAAMLGLVVVGGGGSAPAGAASCTTYVPPSVTTLPVNPSQGGSTTISGAGFPVTSAVLLVVSKTGAKSGPGTIPLGTATTDGTGSFSTVKTWPALGQKFVYLWATSVPCPAKSVRIQVKVAGFGPLVAPGAIPGSQPNSDLGDGAVLGGAVNGKATEAGTELVSSVRRSTEAVAGNAGYLALVAVALVAAGAGTVLLQVGRRRKAAALLTTP